MPLAALGRSRAPLGRPSVPSFGPLQGCPDDARAHAVLARALTEVTPLPTLTTLLSSTGRCSCPSLSTHPRAPLPLSPCRRRRAVVVCAVGVPAPVPWWVEGRGPELRTCRECKTRVRDRCRRGVHRLAISGLMSENCVSCLGLLCKERRLLGWGVCEHGLGRTAGLKCGFEESLQEEDSSQRASHLQG